jgi:membrane fusion protein, multidrug efflux system
MKIRGLIVVVLTGVGAAIAAYTLFNSHDSDTAGQDDDPPPLVSVQVGTLKRRTVHEYVTGYGYVKPAPASVGHATAAAAVSAPVAGVVARVPVVLGQQVRRGDELVELNSDAMTAEYAAEELSRQRKLYAEHDTSLKALQNAEAALSLLRVTSPLSGLVVAVNVKPGASVSQTIPLVEIVDLHRLVVQTRIPEGDAAKLEIGQTVELQGGCSSTTRLSYIGSTVDPSDGTVSVWAPLPAICALRPGQYVSLRIVTATHPDSLVAPSESVVSDLTGNSVLSVVSGSTAIRMPIRAGLREGNWTEVSGTGLKPGTRIVTLGAYGLPRRTAIQVVSGPELSVPSGQTRSAEPP